VLQKLDELLLKHSVALPGRWGDDQKGKNETFFLGSQAPALPVPLFRMRDYYMSPLRGGFCSSLIGIKLFVNHFRFNPLEQNIALPI
jgi:hypothetical protein